MILSERRLSPRPIPARLSILPVDRDPGNMTYAYGRHFSLRLDSYDSVPKTVINIYGLDINSDRRSLGKKIRQRWGSASVLSKEQRLVSDAARYRWIITFHFWAIYLSPICRNLKVRRSAGSTAFSVPANRRPQSRHTK